MSHPTNTYIWGGEWGGRKEKAHDLKQKELELPDCDLL